jgi:hypothetical protein
VIFGPNPVAPIRYLRPDERLKIHPMDNSAALVGPVGNAEGLVGGVRDGR